MDVAPSSTLPRSDSDLLRGRLGEHVSSEAARALASILRTHSLTLDMYVNMPANQARRARGELHCLAEGVSSAVGFDIKSALLMQLHAAIKT